MRTHDAAALDVGLTKWPTMLVTGDPVTREQAAEIIIRTTPLYYLSCNDRAWSSQVYAAFGIEADRTLSEHTFWPAYESVETTRHRLGVLELQYLWNARIASSYIHGPHGWMSWDGTVRQVHGCIGKWPDAGTIYEEWQQIATAFPYLTLQCQLLVDHSQWDDPDPPPPVPVVDFYVEGGAVAAGTPNGILTPIEEPNMEAAATMIAYMDPSVRERGCTLHTLQWAIALTEAKRKAVV